jgi:hypothetical protein
MRAYVAIAAFGARKIQLAAGCLRKLSKNDSKYSALESIDVATVAPSRSDASMVELSGSVLARAGSMPSAI